MATPKPTPVSFLGRIWFPLALVALLLLCIPVLLLVALHIFGADGEVNDWLGRNFQLSYEFPLPWLLGLLFLLVPLLIILLYFLKLKRRPLQVPSTFLWRKSIEDLHVNSLFQWLRENVLLLLQLLAVLLLLYAVMGFRFHGSTAKGQHYILMIDNSASMSATDVKPSRLEWARQEALKVIDAATEDSVGMVIVFNSKASTLQAYTSNKAKLRDAVNSIQQSNRATRIEDALLLADSLANPRRSTENVASRPDNVDPGQERTFVQPKGIPTDVYLFSDGGFPDPPESAIANLNSLLAGNTSALGNMHVRFQLAGKKGPEHVNNVGIVNFSAVRLIEDLGKRTGREPTKLQVLVQVRNYRSGEPEVLKVRLKVTTQGKVRHEDERLVELPPRKVLRGEPGKNLPEKDEPGEVPVSFELPLLDLGTSTVLHASLDGANDDFPLDDQAWLVVGVVRKARVLIVGPGNPVLDAFFKQPATEKLTKLTRLTPADLGKASYREAARGDEYDLVIFDRCAPESDEDMPRANTCFIDRPPPPWQRGTRALKNPFLMVSKKENPLLRHITTLWDVGVTDAFRFNLKDNLPEAARGQFNLDGKEPGKRALPELTRLIEAGGDLPVLFTLPRGSYTDLVMAFPLLSNKGDLTTNWPLQPSFPLFLRNVLMVLGNVNEGMRDATVQPGEPMLLRPEAGIEWLEVTPPGGQPEKLKRGRRPDFIYANTDRVGLYEVLRDDNVRHQFAVNLLDPQESNIEPRERFKVGDDTVTEGSERSQPRDLWKWLVLAGLGFLLLEWYVYNRRVHV
jgi:hypothetical protein